MKEPVFLQRLVINLEQDDSKRRVGTRYPSSDARIYIVDESGVQIPLEIFDLSSSGAYIKSDLLLCPGDEVDLRLELPFIEKDLMLRAKVVRGEVEEHGKGPGMGVSFESISLEHRLLLEKCIRKNRS